MSEPALLHSNDGPSRFVATLCLLAILFVPCSRTSGDSTVRTPPLAESKPRTGERLARVHCAACHLFPEPDLLDKKTWREQTLGRMKLRMGLSPDALEKVAEADLVKSSGVIPAVPMISEEEYRMIGNYYVQSAPEHAPPQDPRQPIQTGLAQFTVEFVARRLSPPSTTLVHISQPTGRVYFGDERTTTLNLLDAGGTGLGSVKVDNVPVALTETARGAYVTMIGHFRPSEDPQGGLAFLRRTEQSFEPAKSLFTKTPRMTHTEFADVNHDGKADLVVCYFGNHIGRFGWHQNLGEDKFTEHVLVAKPGAVRSVVRDFNGDGLRDIAVLIAQETEALILFLNVGDGKFSSQTVFQKPPVYGHTYFEVADFNRDGRPDFLVTNGDNGEYASPLKKYHGVRFYLNQGDNRFEETFFYPLNGAFKAMARDFDGDGDLDIAAISFFPDYGKSPEESFVFLENRGNLSFQASTFRECIAGRWLTMDAGDLDGDGDLDIVLGSYIHGPSDVPDALMLNWEKAGPSVVILRNKGRAPTRSGNP